MTDDVFYTSTELAKLLKITQRTVYRLMERGVLPYYEIGRVKRFRKKEVEEYLQRVRRPGLMKSNHVTCLHLSREIWAAHNIHIAPAKNRN